MEKEQDINFSHFKGNLTRKPILKGNEKKYAILNIACNRPYTNEKGKTVADFISLKVWKDPEKLVNELDRFFAREDFDEYVKPYINAGIKFHLVEDHLVAYAPKNNYEFGIIKDKDEKKYYWYLTPYNKSIFMTAVENGIEMVFFAIKENEELYS